MVGSFRMLLPKAFKKAQVLDAAAWAEDSTGMNNRQKGKPGQEEARKEDTEGDKVRLGRAFKSSQGSWGIKKTIHIPRAGCVLHKTLAKMPSLHLW